MEQPESSKRNLEKQLVQHVVGHVDIDLDREEIDPTSHVEDAIIKAPHQMVDEDVISLVESKFVDVTQSTAQEYVIGNAEDSQ